MTPPLANVEITRLARALLDEYGGDVYLAMLAVETVGDRRARRPAITIHPNRRQGDPPPDDAWNA